MLPERHWWGGNPHYATIWQVNTPQHRLQSQVLEALLIALPESAFQALLADLNQANHLTQVQGVAVEALTQPLIDVVLSAVKALAVDYRLGQETVRLVPVDCLKPLQMPD